MPSEFTEADKAKIASSLSKIIEEDRDKYHVYHDIYHVLKTSCSCVVPSDEVLATPVVRNVVLETNR